VKSKQPAFTDNPVVTGEYKDLVDRMGVELGVIVMVRAMDYLNEPVHPWLRHLCDVSQRNHDEARKAKGAA
jgi:hypothetical protein